MKFRFRSIFEVTLISRISWGEILVKRLSALYKTRNLLARFLLLILGAKIPYSLSKYFSVSNDIKNTELKLPVFFCVISWIALLQILYLISFIGFSKVLQDAILTKHTRWWLAVIETQTSKKREMNFYLSFSFLGYKIVNNQTMNLSEYSNNFRLVKAPWLN